MFEAIARVATGSPLPLGENPRDAQFIERVKLRLSGLPLSMPSDPRRLRSVPRKSVSKVSDQTPLWVKVSRVLATGFSPGRRE